jgi:hypothetical protein
MQPGNQCSHGFAGGIVALMGVGDEEVVGHDKLLSLLAAELDSVGLPHGVQLRQRFL